MKKDYCLFTQQPTVKPHALATCSIWVVPLPIISIGPVRINKLDWATQNRRFACQVGLLSILPQMASATCPFSFPEQTSGEAKTLSHWADSSTSQSVTSADVLVGCKTLLLGAGLIYLLYVYGPSGPWHLVGGLLTPSFAPFGRSGGVTHALVIG